jgi:hypothetical protein
VKKPAAAKRDRHEVWCSRLVTGRSAWLYDGSHRQQRAGAVVFDGALGPFGHAKIAQLVPPLPSAPGRKVSDQWPGTCSSPLCSLLCLSRPPGAPRDAFRGPLKLCQPTRANQAQCRVIHPVQATLLSPQIHPARQTHLCRHPHLRPGRLTLQNRPAHQRRYRHSPCQALSSSTKMGMASGTARNHRLKARQCRWGTLRRSQHPMAPTA